MEENPYQAPKIPSERPARLRETLVNVIVIITCGAIVAMFLSPVAFSWQWRH